MTHLKTFLFFGLVLCVAGLLPIDAFAQQVDTTSWNCKTGTNTLNSIFCGITSQFRFMPRLLAVISYVIAVTLAVQALLQLKDYGDDPSKTPLQSIIIKMVLAAALVSLPLAMQTFITTVTGAKDISSTSALASKPTLGSKVSGK